MPRGPRRRARGRVPYIVGLTGSIAMGKSTAAAMIRDLGIPVFDSDAASRALTARGGAAVAAVGARFPGVVINGAVDRQALGRIVFGQPLELAALEAIIHPLVRASRGRFMRAAAHRRVRMVVVDVPLLFETGGEAACDAVLVVSAPAFLQRQRALARPGMTGEKLAGVLKHQLPDPDKRRRADAVIPSGLGRAFTLRRLKKALIFRDIKSGRRHA